LPRATTVELSVAPGLADVALRELRDLARARGRRLRVVQDRDDALTVEWPGAASELHALRTVAAVWTLRRFEVPRPKALLGDAAARVLAAQVQEVVTRAGAPFSGLRLSAAGRESAVLQRLSAFLAAAAGVRVDEDGGDLHVRVRRGAGDAWEVLVRTTARPLSVRPWRVCDRPGGLDAAVAAAVVRLAGVGAEDRVLGAMVGGGTLLVERALAGPAACLEGVDLDANAVRCTLDNARAAGVAERITVTRGDVTALPHADASFDRVLIDPPWGDAVGAHSDNATLYPALLRELARVAAPGARMALVTHEVRLAERLLADHPEWRAVHTRRVWHGGHRPAVWLLERRARRAPEP
jgi:tRNA (guanine6-N2)-methyltransferase